MYFCALSAIYFMIEMIISITVVVVVIAAAAAAGAQRNPLE